MEIATKEKLAKIGKTIGIGLIGAALAVGTLVGLYFLKKGGSSKEGGS
jgi:hypothetical protein